MSKKKISYLLNKDLPIIKGNYGGNLLINGHFVNEFPREDRHEYSNINTLKWLFIKNPQKREKKADTFMVNTIRNVEIFDSKKDMIVWLGHATFLIRIAGITILTDPSIRIPGFKTYTKSPYTIRDLRNIDYLLISHNHFDHMYPRAIQSIKSSNLSALVPLGVSKQIKRIRRELTVQEAGWYQQYALNRDDLKIYFLPSYHWSMGGITGLDRNKTLWGSFIIQSDKRTIYFAGDTAYSRHFKEIGALFPKIDFCIMPIGTYSPKYLFMLFHMPPQDAVTGFNDLKGKVFIPMHYGTFDQSEEPPGEPIRLLKRLENSNAINGDLKTPGMGEVLEI